MTTIAFVKPSTIGVPLTAAVAEYVNADGTLLYPAHYSVARVTHDGQYAIVCRANTRNSYSLATYVGNADELGLTDRYSADAPVYRLVGFYFHHQKLVDAERMAGEFVGQLAGGSPFVVELPGEAAPRVEQLLAQRATLRDVRGDLDSVRNYGTGSELYTALRSFVADYELTERGRVILLHVITAAAEAVVHGSATYVNAGWTITYTSAPLDAADGVTAAHDAAILQVLQARADRTEWAATLRAQRLVLEAELLPALQVELNLSTVRAQRALELVTLATHSVDDAAVRVLELVGDSGLSYRTTRGSSRIAEELGRNAVELETVESNVVSRTCLTPAAVRESASA